MASQLNDKKPEDIVKQFFEWSQKLPLLSSNVIAGSHFEHEFHGLESRKIKNSSKIVFIAVNLFREKVVTGRTVVPELAFVSGNPLIALMEALTL